MVYKSIFKYYIMLTSFTDSSGFKLFVFAILLLRSSSPVSVVTEIGTAEKESPNGLGSRGWDSPALQGKGLARTVLRCIHSQLALLGYLVYVDQRHQQRGHSRGGSK